MAGSYAYRLDLASSARPARSYAQPSPKKQPPVQVLPGKRGHLDPALSDNTVAVVKIVVVFLVAFLIVGFVRVGLASAAYTTASQSTELSSQIADVRSSTESLEIQKSLLVTPNTLRAKAEEKLNLASPKVTEIITLPTDVVAVDTAGNLSLTQSLSQLAQQG